MERLQTLARVALKPSRDGPVMSTTADSSCGELSPSTLLRTGSAKHLWLVRCAELVENCSEILLPRLRDQNDIIRWLQQHALRTAHSTADNQEQEQN